MEINYIELTQTADGTFVEHEDSLGMPRGIVYDISPFVMCTWTEQMEIDSWISGAVTISLVSSEGRVERTYAEQIMARANNRYFINEVRFNSMYVDLASS